VQDLRGELEHGLRSRVEAHCRIEQRCDMIETSLAKVVQAVQGGIGGGVGEDLRPYVDRGFQEAAEAQANFELRLQEIGADLTAVARLHEDLDTKVERQSLSLEATSRELKAELQGIGGQHMTSSLAQLEAALKQSMSAQREDMVAAQSKLGQLATRLAACERNGATTQEALDSVHTDLKAERRTSMASAPGDSRQADTVAALQALQEIVAELQGAHASFRSDKASLHERLQYLEAALGDSAQRQSAEAEALKRAHDEHSTQLEALLSQGQQGSLSGRMDALEALSRESGDRHSDLKESLARQIRELETMKAAQVLYSSMQERLECVEKVAGDAVERHLTELVAYRGTLSEMSSRIASVEPWGVVIDELRRELGEVAGDRASFGEHSSLVQRVELLEGGTVELAAALKREEEHFRRTKANHVAELEVITMSLEQQSGLADRITDLERAVDQAHERHADSLKGAHMKVEELSEAHGKAVSAIGALQSSHDDLKGSVARKVDLESGHSTLQERVEYLEGALGDSAQKHAQELRKESEELRSAHARHAQALEDLKAAHAHHASIPERLDYVEKALGDNADRHAEALARAHAKLEELSGGQRTAVRDLMDHREAHATAFDEIRSALVGLESERQKGHAALQEHQAALQQRVAGLEGGLRDSADGRLGEAQDLRDAQAEQAQALRVSKEQSASVVLRLEALEKTLAEAVTTTNSLVSATQERLEQMDADGVLAEARSHGPAIQELRRLQERAQAGFESERKSQESGRALLQERVGYLEERCGESIEKHARESQELREACARHARELEGMKAAHTRHELVGERVGSLRDDVNRHAEQVEAAHSKVEDLRKACMSAVSDLSSQHGELSKDRDALGSLHASLHERVEYLEGAFGDSAEHHAREQAALKSVHDKHVQALQELRAAQANHASIPERLNYLEQALGDSSDRHAEALAKAHTKMDGLHKVHGTAVETMMEAHSKVALEKAALEDRHVALEARHTSLQERLGFLEKIHGDSADRHAEELAAAHARLDAMGSEHKAALGELAGQHRSLATGKASLNAQHATMQERVAYLEKALGDSADGHARETEAQRAAHDGHRRELTALRAAHERHASLHERVDDLEKSLGAALGKHSEDLEELLQGRAASEGRHVELAERVASLVKTSDRHAKDLDGVRDAHAQHACLLAGGDAAHARHTAAVEQLASAHRALTQSAEAQDRELAQTKARLEDMRGRVSACEAHGEAIGDLKVAHSAALGELEGHRSELQARQADLHARHAATADRIDNLESVLASSADRHAREVRALHAAHVELAMDAQAHRSKTDEERAAVGEALDHLHQLHGEHADRQREELASTRREHAELASSHGSQVDQIAARLAAEQEANSVALHDLMTKERTERETSHAELRQLSSRVDRLQDAMESSGKRHAGDWSAIKADLSKLVAEESARDSWQAAVAERLSSVEYIQADELRLAHEKMDKMTGRMHAVRSAWHKVTASPLDDQLSSPQKALTLDA